MSIDMETSPEIETDRYLDWQEGKCLWAVLQDGTVPYFSDRLSDFIRRYFKFSYCSKSFR